MAAALFPAESFHHHAEKSVVCQDQSDHIEQKSFECELCDFVLPIFDQQDDAFFGQTLETNFSYSEVKPKGVLPSDYSIPYYRGPPFIV